MPSSWQYIPNETIEDEERDKAATRWQQAQRAQLASEWADRQRAKLQREMQELSRQTMPVGRARLQEEIGRAGVVEDVPSPLEVYNRPQQALFGAVSEARKPGATLSSVGEGARQGITGEREQSGYDFYKGAITGPNLPEQQATVRRGLSDMGAALSGGSRAKQRYEEELRRAGQGVTTAGEGLEHAAGLATDILTDPMDWALAGSGKVGKVGQGVIEGARGLAPVAKAGADLAVRGSGIPAAAEAVLSKGKVGPFSQQLGAASDMLNSPNPTIRTLGKMYTDQPPSDALGTIGQRLESARRAVVRASTDNMVDLAQFQKAAERAKGAPLSPDEMVTELRRLNTDKAAEVRLQEGLQPAFQSVGDDRTALSVYLTLQDNVDVANAMGNASRKFSGGVSLADSRQALTDLEGQLGAARIGTIQQAAQQVWDFNRTLLQRKRDAGLITEALFNDLTSKYPHYVPTRITDYLKDPVTVPRGKSLSVRDTGLRRNTVEGTTRAREDPLASAVRNAYDTETLIRRNDAFNAFVKLKDYDPQYAALIRSVPDSYTATRNEVKVSGFVNGKRETFAMPKEFETLIKAEPAAVIPGAPGAILRGAMGLFRALTTGRNPLFLAGNAFLDAANYTIRESSRAGGPQNLPKVLNELGKAYADSFQGLFQGAYRGDTADFLRGGGGMFGFFQGTPGEARATVEGLSRRHVFEVNGKADIGRLVKDLATLKPVEGVGERIELAPRVASFNLARKQGANNVKAVINGRTVTIDFAQGGDVSKVINQFVPFFNVGMQAGAQMVRGARENPKAYIASALALVGAPTLAAEAWNRSDPQRAKDYEDVPQYIKDQGVVVMLPGEASVDARGNRRPQFAHIRLREFAPIAIVTREAASRALGDDPREWTELVAESLVSVSPIQGNNAADAISSFVPLGVSTGLQLASNKDYFRNSMIATKGRNERASEVAKVIAGALDVQPSQVDFVVGDLGGGVGKIAVAAGQAAAGKMQPSGTASDVPVIGGAIGRFVRSDIGGRLQKAQQQTMSGTSREALKTAGVDLMVGPVGSTIDNVPLKLAEEEQYQVLTNQYVQQDIDSLLKHPVWQQLSPDQRTKLIQDAVAGARDRAGAKVLQTMGNAEIKRRLLKP